MSPSGLSRWLSLFDAFGEDGLCENRAGTLAAIQRGADGVLVKMQFVK
jgi:hypothetical protein